MSQQESAAAVQDRAVRLLNGRRVWVTGHRGMLGSAMLRSLATIDCQLLVTTRQELNLCDQAAVLAWMHDTRPEFIFHIGAMVGGIYANSTRPAEFLYNNLAIQSNVIHGAHVTGAQRLVFVASNCTYPKDSVQPIAEDRLMTGPLEENIHWYGIAKIAGIQLCRAYQKQYGCDFVSVIPPNLYGLGDNYHPNYSHVVAGILRRAHEAKVAGADELIVWGDGTPRRELLNVDDLAAGLKFVMANPAATDLLNVGRGYDLSIAEIASKIAEVVGFKGRIVYDASKPNGTMRKLLDSSRINGLGWLPAIGEAEGLALAYQDFLGSTQRLS